MSAGGTAQPLLEEATGHHRAGNFARAEVLYRKVLETEPRNVDALHLMGLVTAAQGRLDEGAALIEQAIDVQPDFAEAFFNLGVVERQRGDQNRAMSAYRRVLELAPGHLPAAANLANLSYDRREWDDAIELYERALSLDPGSAPLRARLGAALRRVGRYEEAESALIRAAAARPDNPFAYRELGALFDARERYEDAASAYTKAIAADAEDAQSLGGLAMAYVALDRHDDAVRLLERTSAVLRRWERAHRTKRTLPLHRVRHDLEQLAYLDELGVLGRDGEELRQRVSSLFERLRASQGGDRGVMVTLEGEDAEAVSPFYEDVINLSSTGSNSETVINPGIDRDDVDRRFHETKPEIVVVDDLLTPDALSALRRFCLESTIWKTDNPDGYVGAMLENGFGSPLVLQIGQALRDAFPNIFRDHRLRQSWAFKYDSTLSGIDVHADFAAVNVNFWVTPDEANLDPEGGGLVLYDVASPKDWEFMDYNSNQPLIRDYLKRNNARSITVPHRQNRAVIFNSTLFHETDKIRFADEYARRRINVTFLYGSGLRDYA